MKKNIYIKPETESVELTVRGQFLETIGGAGSDEEPPEEGDANNSYWDDDDEEEDNFWSD